MRLRAQEDTTVLVAFKVPHLETLFGGKLTVRAWPSWDIMPPDLFPPGGQLVMKQAAAPPTNNVTTTVTVTPACMPAASIILR